MSVLSPEPNWKRLFRIACLHIRQANLRQPVVDEWTFGGGTALMLHIHHRESQDVDIFLPDPQQLSFLDPDKHDFQFEIRPDAYKADGVRSLRLSFKDIGQIDFIVAGPLTSTPAVQRVIERETVLLETIPEIIVKKIFYRGVKITPRDIFDIAAAGEDHAQIIIEALKKYPAQVAQTVAAIAKLNVEFVNEAVAELALKDTYRKIANTAIQRSNELLHAV